jgi:GNAT superfamily N-acetyltransferase
MITTDNVHLRDARETDRDTIRAVTLGAYEDYATQWFWETYQQNILSTLNDIHPAEQIVAEYAGRIVGAVLLYPIGTVVERPDVGSIRTDAPEIRLLAVAPTARGRGVGRALVQECIRRAHQSGASMLTLHTTDVMQPALRLYTQIGFVRAPELDFHPTPDITVKGYCLRLE